MIKSKQIVKYFGGDGQTQTEAARRIGLSKSIFTTWDGVVNTKSQYAIIGYLVLNGEEIPDFLLKK